MTAVDYLDSNYIMRNTRLKYGLSFTYFIVKSL